MEDTIMVIAKQIPALIVIAFLSVQNMKERESERKHQERREKARAEAQKGETQFRAQMSKECHEIKARALDMLDKAATMLGAATEALRRKKDA